MCYFGVAYFKVDYYWEDVLVQDGMYVLILDKILDERYG